MPTMRGWWLPFALLGGGLLLGALARWLGFRPTSNAQKRRNQSLVVSAALATIAVTILLWARGSTESGVFWLVAWQMALLGATGGAWWIVQHVRPSRKAVDRTAVLLVALVSLGFFSFVGYDLYQIRQCEAYDRCDKAPAWVGEGLHELQRMDGGCVYLPGGCAKDAGR